jgi:hypothetical protein
VAVGAGVPDVKAMIVDACLADPAIETLLLLGHVPVPYSGNVQSAHADHRGAWPADLYYAELDGIWTDEIVTNTTASRPANHNVPGDGKFDQTFLPSDVDLQIGRIDLSLMPAFGGTEVEITRYHLDKNHAYRRCSFVPWPRGLIDDNVGEALGLAFAACGWRNFTAMFGPEGVLERDYFTTLTQDTYLWAYGCGGGSYISCAGVGTTYDFANRSVHTVFTPLYGSYFGDWDNPDNILRAPLAAANQPLACFWAGRPTWHLHHMALGFPIGYSTRLTQNNDREYTVSDGSRQIHVALMGDPTLTQHVARPVTAVHAEPDPGGPVRLTWSPSSASALGYRVFRAAGLRDPFSRLGGGTITDTCFVDPEPLPGRNVYMVRALELQTTASGTYELLSPGVLDSVGVATGLDDHGTPAPPVAVPGHLAPAYPNPFNPQSTLRYHLTAASRVALRIVSMGGRHVRTLVDGPRPAGWQRATWDGRDDKGRPVASGVYGCLLEIGDWRVARRLTLLR